MFLYGGSKPPPYDKKQSSVIIQIKNQNPARFFFCISGRKRKSFQKEKRRNKISRSAERDKSYALLTAQAFEKA